MQTSGQLVTSDTIKSQLSWRLPKPVLPADPMLTAPILPMLVRLSLPNMMAMLAMALVTIAETAYVGALGTPPLAGLALVFPLVMLQQMLSGGAMGGGVSSAISRALGAGDEQRASALAFHAFLIGCVLGLASTLAMVLLGEPIYRLLGGRDTALTQGLTYSNIVFLGAAGIWLTNMLAAVIRAGGNMKIPSVVMMSASIAQVFACRGAWLRLGSRRSGFSEAWHGRHRPRPSDRLQRLRPLSALVSDLGPCASAHHFQQSDTALGFAPRHPQGGRSGVHFAGAIDTVGTNPDPARVEVRDGDAGRLRYWRALGVSADTIGVRRRRHFCVDGRHGDRRRQR
jgi:hypothetical protein